MNRASFLFILGASITIIGAILAVSSGYIVGFFIAKVLPLSENSLSFQKWMKTEVPMHLNFYFWHWSNPEGFLKGEKPILEQKGPYRFREKHEKVNVTHNDNGTITYQRGRWWYFDPEGSNGTLDDLITTVNPVAASAAFVSRKRSAFIQVTLSTSMRMTKQEIWVTRTVNELLFEGYSDALLTMATKMPNLAQTKIPGDKFGWFYQRNGSWAYDGVFNIDTGESDISKIGSLSNWNYGNRTEFYPGACGQVNGSAGELFPPNREKGQPLEMYSSDLCRSVKFEYAKEVEFHGIVGYQYIGGRSLMDNGTDDPSTECFCGGECVPQGVLNVSSCRFGAPAFVSYPHFLDADPFYINQVEGLNPEPEHHRFRITIEPNTGIPLDVAARFQINLLLQPNDYVAMYNDVPKIFFPMMWFDERATITPEVATSLYYLLMVRYIILYSTVALFLGGVIILLVSLVPRFFRKWTLPTLADKRKDGAVLYQRECIRPLIKGKSDTISPLSAASDPPNSSSTPA